MLPPIGVITPVRFYVILSWECFGLLSAKCVNFVCNEGIVVQLSVPYIRLCGFSKDKQTDPQTGVPVEVPPVKHIQRK